MYLRPCVAGIDVLCIVLRRLAYPNRYVDLCPLFPWTERELCLLFSTGLDFLYDRWGGKLRSLNQPWLSLGKLQQFCAAIHARGAPLQNCWGFIDGTVRPACRPTFHQREVYNGHKRVHGLKFQAIVTPDGLIANLYGPESGRRHDAYLFQASGVLPYMQQNMNVNGQPLCLYGDSAYPQAAHIMRPYLGNLTPQQEQFNTAMARVRQAVEWGFGDIVRYWAFLDFKKNLRIFQAPVAKLYTVGALLTNCLACKYPWAGGRVGYFNLDPPSLQEYLQ